MAEPSAPKNHPQAYFASHAQLYSWYEVLLGAAIHGVVSGDIGKIYEALKHINPNNWVETETADAPYYVVQDGDSLSMIALKYGKSDPKDLGVLVRLNWYSMLHAPHHLIAGQHLLIPPGWGNLYE